MLVAEASADVVAAAGGEHDVEDDQIGLAAAQDAHALLGVEGAERGKAFLAEVVVDGLDDGALVIDHEYRRHGR